MKVERSRKPLPAALLSTVTIVAGSILSTPAARQAIPERSPLGQPSQHAVPFAAGETLTYTVGWTVFSGAGVVTVTTREQTTPAGQPACYIVGEARATGFLSKLYHLYYKADTLLDTTSLLPWRSTIYSEEGRRRRVRTTRFEWESGQVEFEQQTDSVFKKKVAVPPGTQDVLSAIYSFRARREPRGETSAMTVTDGGRVYTVRVAIEGKEVVETAIGSFSAWRVTPQVLNERGQPEGRRIVFWFSDDARRLPVRLRVDLAVGLLNLTLREASPPRTGGGASSPARSSNPRD